VEHGRTGYTNSTPAEFITSVLDLVHNVDLRNQFRQASRCAALRFDWDTVFTSLYAAYQTVLPCQRRSTTDAAH
jgi:hypothetical protein